MLKEVIDFLFPPLCYACTEKLSEDFLCEDCWKDIMGNTVFESEYYYGFKVYSLFSYNGKVKNIVQNFKYGGFRKIANKFSKHLAEMVSDEEIDVIVPIPLHPARVRERGFSQTFELAKVLSKELKKPVRNYIFRHSYRKVQALISSRDERMKNVKGVFSYLRRIDNEKVLLVDDVITTGYTFYEAAKTLIEAGARDVIGITLAKGG